MKQKPLTHDPSQRPVMMRCCNGLSQQAIFFGSHLDGRKEGSCDKRCLHNGHQDGCQKTTPVMTAVMTARRDGRHDGSCVRGLTEFILVTDWFMSRLTQKCHFRDVLPSQSLMVLKKINLTQQMQTCTTTKNVSGLFLQLQAHMRQTHSTDKQSW